MDTVFNEKIEKLDKKIRNSKRIYISSHVNPDGDSLGSILSLGEAIKIKYENKDIKIAIKDNIPKYLQFMKTSIIENIIEYEEADMLFILDCGDTDRVQIKGMDKIKTIVNIDHHITNTYYGDLNIVSPEHSSTSELVYDVIKGLDIELSSSMAENIYVGISTDTGSFKYRNTKSKTHKIISEILEIGIDLDEITKNLYQNKSINDVMFIKESIDNLEFFEKNKICILAITDGILKKVNMKIEEVNDMVNFIRDIDTVEIACVLKNTEVKDQTKISLRSKGRSDVSRVAKKFGGGGHEKAAGCVINTNIEDAKDMVLAEIIKELKL